MCIRDSGEGVNDLGAARGAVVARLGDVAFGAERVDEPREWEPSWAVATDDELPAAKQMTRAKRMARRVMCAAPHNHRIWAVVACKLPIKTFGCSRGLFLRLVFGFFSLAIAPQVRADPWGHRRLNRRLDN